MLTNTDHLSIDHSQPTPQSHQYHALMSHPLTPNVAPLGHAVNVETWLNPVYYFLEPRPQGAPTFQPLLSTQSRRFQPEIVNHPPVPAPNSSLYTCPIQNQSDSHLNWEAMRVPCNPGPISTPPRVETEGFSRYKNSDPVSPGVSLESQDRPPRIGTSHDRRERPRTSSRAVCCQPPLSRSPPQRAAPRSYTRPGKEPAAAFEPDAVKLHASCARRGGDAFAVDWVLVVFKHGVTKDALFRALGRDEIDQAGVDAPGGFELGKAYDGFLAKIGDRYGCGLCKEGRRTYWKHKKDAPRHLRKFHFGLADICNICNKRLYCNAEMKSHCCRPARAI